MSAVCGRQCGKTEGVAFKLADACAKNPHAVVPYITTSRPAAKRILWPKLWRINRELNLGAAFNGSELSMTFKNGSKIILGGASDQAEIERYRGISTPLACIDEAQAFKPYLKSLVKAVLFPATVAYAGQVVMIGTPNASCTGFFHDVTTGQVENAEMWSNHHWDITTNVFVKNYQDQLAEARRVNGYTEKSPQYRREWLGEWVRNTEGLAYNLRPSSLLREVPAAPDWCYTLGIDVGYVDATAFVILAYSQALGMTVVVRSFQETGLTPSGIAAHVERLSASYDFESVVIDPGGGGKFIVEELAQRYAVPAEVAQKQAKHAAIELLNGDIRTGSFFVLRNGNEELIHDAAMLTWDYEKAPDVGGFRPSEKRVLSSRHPQHLLDAMLYGWRKTRSYLWSPERGRPIPGTAEDFKRQEDEILERALERARGASEDQAFWEEGY